MYIFGTATLVIAIASCCGALVRVKKTFDEHGFSYQAFVAIFDIGYQLIGMPVVLAINAVKQAAEGPQQEQAPSAPPRDDAYHAVQLQLAALQAELGILQRQRQAAEGHFNQPGGEPQQ